jgi:hypothetical protein
MLDAQAEPCVMLVNETPIWNNVLDVVDTVDATDMLTPASELDALGRLDALDDEGVPSVCSVLGVRSELDVIGKLPVLDGWDVTGLEGVLDPTIELDAIRPLCTPFEEDTADSKDVLVPISMLDIADMISKADVLARREEPWTVVVPKESMLEAGEALSVKSFEGGAEKELKAIVTLLIAIVLDKGSVFEVKDAVCVPDAETVHTTRSEVTVVELLGDKNGFDERLVPASRFVGLVLKPEESKLDDLADDNMIAVSALEL